MQKASEDSSMLIYLGIHLRCGVKSLTRSIYYVLFHFLVVLVPENYLCWSNEHVSGSLVGFSLFKMYASIRKRVLKKKKSAGSLIMNNFFKLNELN